MPSCTMANMLAELGNEVCGGVRINILDCTGVDVFKMFFCHMSREVTLKSPAHQMIRRGSKLFGGDSWPLNSFNFP